MDSKILFAAGVCLIENQKILLLKEASSGLWGPPAGHMEKGENLLQTAVRETKEEIGLDVKITGLIQCGILKIPDGRVYLAAFYSATSPNLKKIKPDSNEVADFYWATKEEIENDKFEFRKSFLKSVLLRAFDSQPVPVDTFLVVDTE